MANNVRFIDNVSVSSYGDRTGTSISSSYALSASYADTALTASYAISASHEIVKEVSSSHADFAVSSSYADTASYAGQLFGSPSITVTNVTASGNISSSGYYYGDGSQLTGISQSLWTGSNGIITRDSDVEVTGSLDVTNTGSLRYLTLGKNASSDGRIKFYSDSGPSFELGVVTGTGNDTFTLQGSSGAQIQDFALDSKIENFILKGGGAINIAHGTTTGSYKGGGVHINRQGTGLSNGTKGIFSTDVTGPYIGNSSYGSTGAHGTFRIINGLNPDNDADSGSFTVSEFGDWINFNLPITASSNISASGAITASGFQGDGSGLTGINASNWTSSEANISREGDVSITGSLTVTGSGTLTNIGPFSQTGTAAFTGSIIASGGVSSSGNLNANRIYANAGQVNVLDSGVQHIHLSAGDNSYVSMSGGHYGFIVGQASMGNPGELGSQGNKFMVNGDALIKASLTASGDISSSGNIFGNNAIFSNITASAGISASGAITASGFHGDGSGLTGIVSSNWTSSGANISRESDVLITGSLVISGSFNAFTLDSDNIVLGAGAGVAMTANTNDNVIIGPNAGAALTDADANVFVGKNAGSTVTAGGEQNVAIGWYAMQDQDSDSIRNVYIGYQAGRMGRSTRGNVGLGMYSLFGVDNNDNEYNTAIGYGTGYSIDGGDYNQLFGYQSGYDLTSGHHNVLLGWEAGRGITTGNHNIIIGISSSTDIVSDTSHKLLIGSGSVAVISASLLTGDIIFPSTASAAVFSGSTYYGDGSNLTGIASSNWTSSGANISRKGDVRITGSLEVSGSYKVISPTRGTMFDITSAGVFTLGPGASAGGGYTAVAIGHNANVGNNYSVAIGSGANTNSNQYSVAIGGVGVSANGFGAVTIGGNTVTAGAYGISMGYQAAASGDYSINLGRSSRGTGDNSVTFNTSGDGIAAPSNTRAFNVYLSDGTGNPDFIISSSNESKLSGSSFTIEKSGSTVFDVIGSEGTLFSVDDDLTGTLFTVNDISGLPVLEASSSGDVYIGKSPQSLYTTAVISATSASATQSLCILNTSSYDSAFFDYTVHSASNARAGSIMAVWSASVISYTETSTSDIGNTSPIDFNVIISSSGASLVSVTDSTSPNTWKVKTIIKAI